MNLVVLDHETYYDTDYSLSKMSTEEYVADDRYQTMLVSIKRNNEPTQCFSGSTEDTTQWLYDNKVHLSGVVCHHHMFDGLVNLVRHGFVPPVMFCTRFMAKAILQPHLRSVSLAACLKYINAPIVKGSYLANMKGRRRESLSKSELRDYAHYCATDTDGTHYLFHHLLEQLPRPELEIIDLTLRMYLQPKLFADAQTFKNVYDAEVAHKQHLLNQMPAEIQRADLMSNEKFALVLKRMGIMPPVKVSPTTGKTTWAFAKSDPGWKDLEEEYADDSIVAPILAARIGTKSTIAETRAARLLDIANNFGKFRAPLVYYGALTGRYGGTEKINCQNFTRVKRHKDGTPTTRDQLRFGLQALRHHSVIAVDASQIEARITAWLADCKILMALFGQGADVYSAFATRLFAKPVSKDTPTERFIGKTCILGLGYGMGAGTLKQTLRKDNLIVSEAEAQDYVDTYRGEYPQIPALWRFNDNTIEVLRSGGKKRVGPCMAELGRITLPNGLALQYPGIKYINTQKYNGWGYTYAGIVRTMWGGKLTENIVQALARIKITEAMREIKREMGYRPVLQAHDELVYVGLTKDAQDLVDGMCAIMSRPPEWAPTLPLAAEGGFGPTYGDCK